LILAEKQKKKSDKDEQKIKTESSKTNGQDEAKTVGDETLEIVATEEKELEVVEEKEAK